MAKVNDTITIKTAEYRPCYVNGNKALFHKWAEEEKLILKERPYFDKEGYKKSYALFKENGIVEPCYDIDKAKATYAIVEFEDGRIEKVEPQNIRFADNLIKEYAFSEVEK